MYWTWTATLPLHLTLYPIMKKKLEVCQSGRVDQTMSSYVHIQKRVSSYSLVTGLHGLENKKKNKRKIVNNFLPIIFNICFGCSKEPSH